ncbi:MAG: hypothetical protein K9W43_07405 [Candidatus Thorarchaeota archaeon]|nr:hypothetical protein [Candidatus Thorarchaeota archaeon]
MSKFGVAARNPLLLDWIWPVLVKPALQVFCTGILGGLTAPLIGSLITAAISRMSMFVLTFLGAIITYAISLLMPYITAVLGVGNIMSQINGILIPMASTYISGPLSRKLALKLGSLTMTADLALDKIGVSSIVGIAIGVLGFGVIGVVVGWLLGELAVVTVFGLAATRPLKVKSSPIDMRPVLAFAPPSLLFQTVDEYN